MAVQFPSKSCHLVKFKALPGNAAVVYVGASTVTSSNGYPIAAGVETDWIPVDNVNRFYYAGTSGDSIAILSLS